MDSAIDVQVDKIAKIIEDVSPDITLPLYLIRLLAYKGFDNVFSISKISESHISEIEEFAKQVLPALLDKEEVGKFYGIYAKKPELFEIQTGHKILLQQLISSCKFAWGSSTNSSSSKRRSDLGSHCICAVHSKKKKTTRKTLNNPVSTAYNNGRGENDDINSSGHTEEEDDSLPAQSQEDKDKSLTEISGIVSNYIKKFCTENLKEDGRCNAVLEKLQDVKIISLDDGGSYSVQCLMCSFVSRAYIKQLHGSKKTNWTLSNYNKHFKTHFKDVLAKTRVAEGSPHITNPPFNPLKNSTLLSFISVEKKSKPSSSKRLLPQINRVETIELDDPTEESMEITEVDDPCFTNNQNFEQDLQFHSERRVDKTTIGQVNSVEMVLANSPVTNPLTLCKKNNLTSKTESRTERLQKKMSFAALDPAQTKITEFFKLCESVKLQIDNDPVITATFSRYHQAIGLNPEELTTGPPFLEMLKETAIANSKHKKHGSRFSEPLKLFSLYLFIVGGRFTYELLYSNLSGALPSITTLNRLLDEGAKIVEGVSRLQELKSYLIKRNYRLQVFVSEDQTAVIRRIYYDPKINQMVGFVLPISEKTGFPITEKFTVCSLVDIKNAFKNEEISKNAYVYMAQPLHDKAPAFCLVIFGSSNSFSNQDVLKRWKKLESETNKIEINIFGFSSDADTRCLKAMRIRSGLASTSVRTHDSPYGPYFQCNYDVKSPVCVQDTVHIATKMKTRLLKPNIVLPMGQYFVSKDFIEKLIKTYPKDQHFLCMSYLKSQDKMNFEAIDKMTANCVTDLLQEFPGSDATRLYLIVTRYCLDAYLDKDISISKRIYYIWFATFFLRYWRKWLKFNKYSITENGLTSSTYSCIELNAHGLILLTEKCRETPDSFLPWLWSSQPCEKIFRQTRSMTSTFSTVVNYGMSDILRRLNRIQKLNEISSDMDTSFKFPREESRRLGGGNASINQIFPSHFEINNILERARKDVMLECEKLGMVLENAEKAFQEISLRNIDAQVDAVEELDSDQADDEESEQFGEPFDSDPESEAIKNDLSVLSNIKSLNLKDHAKSNVSKSSPLLKISINKDKQITVRKSSLCWLFSEKHHMSSDRTLRVRDMGSASKRKNTKVLANLRNKNKKNEEEVAEISLGPETSEEEEYSERSDTLTEVFSESEEEISTSDIDVKCEEYYAVYFDQQWYIGRVLSCSDTSCKIKFLKDDLDEFIWPTREDIQMVDKQFVIYGPLHLAGNGPFKLKRNEKNIVNKKYKEFKKILEKI